MVDERKRGQISFLAILKGLATCFGSILFLLLFAEFIKPKISNGPRADPAQEKAAIVEQEIFGKQVWAADKSYLDGKPQSALDQYNRLAANYYSFHGTIFNTKVAACLESLGDYSKAASRLVAMDPHGFPMVSGIDYVDAELALMAIRNSDEKTLIFSVKRMDPGFSKDQVKAFERLGEMMGKVNNRFGVEYAYTRAFQMSGRNVSVAKDYSECLARNFDNRIASYKTFLVTSQHRTPEGDSDIERELSHVPEWIHQDFPRLTKGIQPDPSPSYEIAHQGSLHAFGVY